MGVERRRPVRPRDQRTERQTWHPGAELRWVDRLDERRHAGVPAPSDHEQRNRRGGVREWRWPKRRAIGSTSVALLLSASSGMGAEAGEAQVPALFGALCHNIVRSAKGTSGCFLAALRMSIGRSQEVEPHREPMNRLESLSCSLRVIIHVLQGLARVYIRHVFAGFAPCPLIAPYCAPGGVRVVSGIRRVLGEGSLSDRSATTVL